MFSCVWLYFKKCFEKYFLMFGCVLENTIEKTFSTCCSHFLTFSQLPNEYIISFIPKNTNKTHKRSHFLGEIAIEIGAISISEIEIDEITIAISPISIVRSRSCDRRFPRDRDRRWSAQSGDHDCDRRRSFSLSRAECVLFAWVFSFYGSLSLLRFFRKSFNGKTTM